MCRLMSIELLVYIKLLIRSRNDAIPLIHLWCVAHRITAIIQHIILRENLTYGAVMSLLDSIARGHRLSAHQSILIHVRHGKTPASCHQRLHYRTRTLTRRSLI